MAPERGKARKLRRGFCISRTAGGVSFEQKGHAVCVFRAPKGKRLLRIYLQPDDGKYRSEGYCLRK